MVQPVEERFWEKVDASGDCWEWTAPTEKKGYGRVKIGRRGVLAHRVAYELLVGPIPEGLTLDHLCRNRRCVNPDHLEPVTNRENILRGTSTPALNARKTHCKRGHPFDDENTYVRPSGARGCRSCRNAWHQNQKARNRS